MSDHTLIRFACPYCNESLSAEPKAAGTTIVCPGLECAELLLVPLISSRAAKTTALLEQSKAAGSSRVPQLPTDRRGLRELGQGLLMAIAFGAAFLGLNYLLYMNLTRPAPEVNDLPYGYEVADVDQAAGTILYRTVRVGYGALIGFIVAYALSGLGTLAGLMWVREAVTDLTKGRR
jgi:hypothetical protein